MAKLAGSSLTSLPFRFDAARHEYTELETGRVLPHCTGMLQATTRRNGKPWVDATWFTEESSERGKAVHTMTAEYDLEALAADDIISMNHAYKGYLQAHLYAVGILKPEWLDVEVPIVHPHFRFGCRPDRTCIVRRFKAVWEVKSGEKSDAHQIQTALQAIAVSPKLGLPAPAIKRYCAYYSANGRAHVEEHVERTDFDEALRIIRETCK